MVTIMRIWQSGNLWYVNIGNNIELSFVTQQEALKVMAKLDTAKAVVTAIKTLTTVADAAPSLIEEVSDVGPFTNEDLVALGITRNELNGCITVLEQLRLLITGGIAVPAVAYKTTLNKMRRVST
jgi:hypothetical protein